MTKKTPKKGNKPNLTPEILADELGRLNLEKDKIEKEMNALKEDAKKLGLEKITGTKFEVSFSPVTTERLNTKLVKEKLSAILKPSQMAKYINTSSSVRTTIKYIGENN